jgi:hypothetical protein
VVAVSLLNGPDPHPYFKQQTILSGFNSHCKYVVGYVTQQQVKNTHQWFWT